MAAVVVVPAAAGAHVHRTLCERAYPVRLHVKARYGERVAGRNICHYGVPTRERPRGLARRATTAERARYLRALVALAQPAPPYLSVHPGAPSIGHSHTLTVHYRPEGPARCVAYAESGNQANPGGQTAHEGVGQWAWGFPGSAWELDGGLRFAYEPTGATYDEQMLVLSRAFQLYGCSQFCPFDPC